MTNKRKPNPNGDSQAAQVVLLEFSHPTAKAIAIAGTFNEWRPEFTPMVSLGEGRWIKQLILAPGVYEYRWVVDGEWMPDRRAGGTVRYPLGGRNFVLRVNGRAT